MLAVATASAVSILIISTMIDASSIINASGGSINMAAFTTVFNDFFQRNEASVCCS